MSFAEWSKNAKKDHKKGNPSSSSTTGIEDSEVVYFLHSKFNYTQKFHSKFNYTQKFHSK